MDLSKAIPGFNDPAQRKQIMQSIDEYALGLGFSRAEINNIKDPRLVVMAYQASQSQGTKDGFISGPGDTQSDSIPRLLSDGEYVIKASVVNALGREFFDKLNNSVK